MSVIWYKVWFDLWRNKVRTILAIFSIAAGVFAIGAIFGMVVGVEGRHAGREQQRDRRPSHADAPLDAAPGEPVQDEQPHREQR
ncbi:MAG: hypothetical protein AAF485_09385, partial [Chloroflexota bacterium]